MSREIKFRAWDRKAKWMFPIQDIKWDKITGELIHLSGVDVSHPDSDHEGNVFFGGSANKLTGTPAINQFELMQYTGLKDMFGKDIYESDILDHESLAGYKHLLIVRWNDRESGFDFGHLRPVYGKNSRVIGNIYANPELLETRA